MLILEDTILKMEEEEILEIDFKTIQIQLNLDVVQQVDLDLPFDSTHRKFMIKMI